MPKPRISVYLPRRLGRVCNVPMLMGRRKMLEKSVLLFRNQQVYCRQKIILMGLSLSLLEIKEQRH